MGRGHKPRGHHRVGAGPGRHRSLIQIARRRLSSDGRTARAHGAQRCRVGMDRAMTTAWMSSGSTREDVEMTDERRGEAASDEPSDVEAEDAVNPPAKGSARHEPGMEPDEIKWRPGTEPGPDATE